MAKNKKVVETVQHQEVYVQKDVEVKKEVKSIDVVEKVFEPKVKSIDVETKKEVKTIDTVEKTVEIKKELKVEPVIDKIIRTESTFGKYRVVDNEITVYAKSKLTGKEETRVLKKGDTFYFDAIHTMENGSVYVSWNGHTARNYTLIVDSKTKKSPVVKIG